MNKITPNSSFICHENIMDSRLHVSRCQFWPLGTLWKGRKEKNWFWRFYYNEGPGAGIIFRNHHIELTPDMFCLVSPGTPFETWQNKNIRQFYIHFDTLLMSAQVRENIYTFALPETLKTLIYAIDRQFQQSATTLPIHIQTHCLTICSMALSIIPENDFIPHNIPNEVMFAVHQLKANIAREVSIDQLASSVAMAPNTLIRLFRKHIGTTPYQFLTDLRMDSACQLLSESELPIAAVAAQVGYKDRFHFSRLFKKKTAITPAAYRKQTAASS